jgi:hypothetical protein
MSRQNWLIELIIRYERSSYTQRRGRMPHLRPTDDLICHQARIRGKLVHIPMQAVRPVDGGTRKLDNFGTDQVASRAVRLALCLPTKQKAAFKVACNTRTKTKWIECVDARGV